MSFELHPDQPPLSGADRTRVLETLRHFDGTRFTLHASLVLDRKAYAVVTPFVERPLERIIGGWKRWLSGLFGLDGRAAPFWKRGYFDRVMRGPEEVARRIEQLKTLSGGGGAELSSAPTRHDRCQSVWVRGEGEGADPVDR